jgi:hypothetical protein
MVFRVTKVPSDGVGMELGAFAFGGLACCIACEALKVLSTSCV